MPKTAAHLVFRFANTNGTPVHDLTNWLGMPAHGIVLSPDLKTFQHVHGMADSMGAMSGHHHSGTMSSTSTGPIGVDVTLPKAGRYKMFFQFQRGTTVTTAPFVLEVMPSHGPTPAEPSCATMTCPTGQDCMTMGSPPTPMCM